MDEDKDVDVERLPKIGQPFSIKTRKQGRRSSIGEIVHEMYDATGLTRDGKSGTSLRRRDLRRNSIDMTIVLINRIKKFSESTKNMVALCDAYLDWLKSNSEEKDSIIAAKRTAKTIAGINRTLARRYGDKYINCNLKGKNNEEKKN